MKKFLKVLGYMFIGIGILMFLMFCFAGVGMTMLSVLFGNMVGFFLMGLFDFLLLINLVCEIVILTKAEQENE